MRNTISITRHYDHSITKVWHALTDPEALSKWLMPCDFQPVLGHEFEFRTRPRGSFDGITRCKVVTLDEPQHLAYTWSGGNLKDTLVTFKLVSEGEQRTRLDFEHSGFEGFVNNVIVKRILAFGWRGKLLSKQLPQYLAL